MQHFAADTANGVTLPAQQFVGFSLVDLDPGTTKTVRFNADIVMEPGSIEFAVSRSCNDTRLAASLDVTRESAFLSEAAIKDAEVPLQTAVDCLNSEACA